jgi:tetratricopeptide (TPR) repeat protein
LTNNPRVEELRRRLQKDPASIAFAQLAEEYRRAGQYTEAVDVARSGLAHHPTYLSARVTLGRALIELAAYNDAQAELEDVLRAAPENLAAIRGLAEIHQRRGEPAELEQPFVGQTAEPIEAPSQGIAAGAELVAAAPDVEDAPGMLEPPADGWELETFAPASTSPAPADEDVIAERVEQAPAAVIAPSGPAGDWELETFAPAATTPPPSVDAAALRELEAWLEAILRERLRA